MNLRRILAVVAAVVLIATVLSFSTRSKRLTTSNQISTEHNTLYTCGMHPQVLQDHPGNCPICHMKLVPVKSSSAEANSDSENKSGESRKVKYYWDPMLGADSISDKPGKSAMGMDLVPVYQDGEDEGPRVHIDPSVIQNVGIRTATVSEESLTQTIRASGILTLPEPGLHDVSLKVSGWIEKLYTDKEGMHVTKGDPLFEIYSPDLQVAEEEFISAAKSEKIIQGLSKDISNDLLASARRKLKFLDIGDPEIEALQKATHPPRTTLFRSPSSGHVEEKAIVEGASVQPGMKLLRIADHSSLWLQIQVFSGNIPLLSLGQQVEATIDGIPGKRFTGEIEFIYPHLDHMTRTVTARIVLPNAGFELKPGMYGTATIRAKLKASALQVPREAVIDTGEKQIAFVALEGGHFEPRKVQMGSMGEDGRVEILSGLKANEAVVTSGQFLLDVESRTTEAIQKIRQLKTTDSSAMSDMEMPK